MFSLGFVCKRRARVECSAAPETTARYLKSGEAAMGCIAGCCIFNDVSERVFQMEPGRSVDNKKKLRHVSSFLARGLLHGTKLPS